MNINFLPVEPKQKFPIILIGAGGIVKDAHLPAYQKAGFDVIGIFDLDQDKAKHLAQVFDIPHVYPSLKAAIQHAPEHVVWDVALPSGFVRELLEQLPHHSHVLIQKPMGESIADAQEILSCIQDKKLQGGVNFQLRYAPLSIGARSILEQDEMGELVDMEIKVTSHTPWGLWDFLKGHPRVEILYHSIHYIDLIRSFMGEPKRIFAHSTGHPSCPEISSTRSSVIMDYGPYRRASVHTNHDHAFGPDLVESYVKWEGTSGAIRAQMGVNMDYPKGRDDDFKFCSIKASKPTWVLKDLPGNWFPDAFIGPMSDLMRLKHGEISQMPSSFEDAFKTMTWVEKAYACQQ